MLLIRLDKEHSLGWVKLSLDKEELRRGFESMGETLTDPELATIVAMADTDKDGQVSCEEFELLATTLAEVAALKAELGVE